MSPFSKNIEIDEVLPDRKDVLNLSSPRAGVSPVTSLDLDLTLNCNLKCTYCFKEKYNQDMTKKTAYDAVIWLLYASGASNNLRVTFMGGEPLLRFDLIKTLVPFAKRRAAYLGKNIHFSITTNNTLVTDEVVSFWKMWGMGFHCSIDGVPDVQNVNRPTVSGRDSSMLVETGINKILKSRPDTCARCTVVPSNIRYLTENYKYFRELGFVDIAMVPGNPSLWDDRANVLLKNEFEKLLLLLQEDYCNGQTITVKGITDVAEFIAKKKKRSSMMCGAGRGMVLVDVNGDIWPCHRWNKATHKEWMLGSIYGEFSNGIRSVLDVKSQVFKLKSECECCRASQFCSGGCPAENLEEQGDVYLPHSSKCHHSIMFVELGTRFHEEMYSKQVPAFMQRFYGDN
jgi:uncharacterized protein